MVWASTNFILMLKINMAFFLFFFCFPKQTKETEIDTEMLVNVWENSKKLKVPLHDESPIFSIEDILKHKQVTCMTKKKMFTFFK